MEPTLKIRYLYFSPQPHQNRPGQPYRSGWANFITAVALYAIPAPEYYLILSNLQGFGLAGADFLAVAA